MFRRLRLTPPLGGTTCSADAHCIASGLAAFVATRERQGPAGFRPARELKNSCEANKGNVFDDAAQLCTIAIGATASVSLAHSFTRAVTEARCGKPEVNLGSLCVGVHQIRSRGRKVYRAWSALVALSTKRRILKGASIVMRKQGLRRH